MTLARICTVGTLFILTSLPLSAQSRSVAPNKLAPGGHPSEGAVVFPERREAPGDHGVRLVGQGDGRYIAVWDDFPEAESVVPPPTAEESERAKEVLRRMAAFFEAQDAFGFELEYYINEDGYMSVARPTTDMYRFTFHRPNFFRATRTSSDSGGGLSTIASNGRHILRHAWNHVFVEDAPASLSELVAADAFGQSWYKTVDARSLMSLFDPVALERWIQTVELKYVGVEQYGTVEVDHIVADGKGEVGRFPIWHLYITRCSSPIPVRIGIDYADVNGARGRDRFWDTDWRLTDWNFNLPIQSASYTLRMPEVPLVDSVRRMVGGEPTTMPALHGEPVPPFQATDRLGSTVNSEDLVRGKPSLLLPFADGNAMLTNWKNVDRAIGRFDAGAVDVYAFYTGSSLEGAEVFDAFSRSGFRQRDGWRSVPTVLDMADSRLPLPTRAVYLVDGDGVIQSVFSLYNARDIDVSIAAAITRLLNGEDVARRDAEALAQRVSERRERRRNLEEAFREHEHRLPTEESTRIRQPTR